MRPRFARVKWLAQEIGKSLSSGQDLGERCVVICTGFAQGAVGFRVTWERPGFLRSKEPQEGPGFLGGWPVHITALGLFQKMRDSSPFDFCVLQVIENKGLKKSLLKMKFSLDKILFCARISLVEKCAPIQVGAFCF